jgi:excinuclease ABC subunit C
MRLKGNNDFAHMHEALSRRLSDKNVKQWGLPTLFLIDGGKGQLGAAIRARDELGINVPMVGLAKREEEIVVHVEKSLVTVEGLQERARKLHASLQESDDFVLIDLPDTNDMVKLLQRVRDESHRFAVTYHSTLKANRQLTSWLDAVPGIGPTTKRKLIRIFGSSRGVLQARYEELEDLLGESKATILKQYIRAEKKVDRN